MIERVVWSNGIEIVAYRVNRLARFDINLNGKRHYFYIYAEAYIMKLREWQVTGRSIFFEGAIRLPKAEEMIWL
ncbi:hypothetical protein IPH92_02875 [Candidatus Kaiserbacteria bacterium]|nr:MAG: hypothetical protein IPH92_02875 [Candidatus Kaiserbacteria bacterium]